MGLRFRRSFRLFPGVRMNLSGRGISASFGIPGATVNLSSRGVRGTVGIPGTGLSYSTQIGAGHQPKALTHSTLPEASYWTPPAPVPAQPIPPQLPVSPGGAPPKEVYVRQPGMREIGSAAVESLTSSSLEQFRQMIADAKAQRSEVTADLSVAKRDAEQRSWELQKKSKSLLKFLYKKRIAELEETVPQLKDEVQTLESWLEATHIQVEFESQDRPQRAYASLVRAYDGLCRCAMAWDVTADRETNRALERSSAQRTVDRRPIKLEYSKSDLIRFPGRALRFPNCNGEDLLIYPGMILMERCDGAFALIALQDVELEADSHGFIEEQQVPPDTKVIGETWAKTNKDGSPDRRFANNYRIPVCSYGSLLFSSPNGLMEEFQFSNAQAAIAFGQAFVIYRNALAES